MTKKDFDVFISFAEPDKLLAHELCLLLEEVDLRGYYAHEELGRAGTSDWRKQIHDGIRRSRCFLPIMTRSSMWRPWVLYERGAADANGLELVPARVQGLSQRDLSAIPFGDPYVHVLFDKDGLKRLVLDLWRYIHPKMEKGNALTTVVDNSEHAENVIRIAKTRWVFIAGSKPEDEEIYDPALKVIGKPGLEGPAVLRRVARDIANGLLDSGFNLMSCPEVPDVGKVVSDTVLERLDSSKSIDANRYRIGGIYPVRELLKLGEGSFEKRGHVANWLSEFRTQYLAPVEWLVILGGNEGTKAEAMAATNELTKICTIPALGGYGQSPIEHPDAFRFETEGDQWGVEQMQKLIERIRE